jgi:hypothetical protein
MKLIPNNDKRHTTFDKTITDIKLRFIDSLEFWGFNLGKVASNLTREQMENIKLLPRSQFRFINLESCISISTTTWSAGRSSKKRSSHLKRLFT